ncbi:MAG: ComEC/Rec2 family competence protein [bacterium]
MVNTPSQSHFVKKVRRQRRWIAIAAASCIVLGACFLAHAGHPFRFIVFDVGEGDSLFLEAPNGQQMLIDGGPTNGVLEKLGRAMPSFDRSLDIIVLTHPDADHLTGLVEVVRRYRIGQILFTGVQDSTATYQTFLALLLERDVRTTSVVAGDTVSFGGATLTILAPFASWQDREAKEMNNTGIVSRLDYRAFSLLLTADVDTTVESALVRASSNLQATVLKVGHHGSKFSTSAALLSAVQPQLAVISVGEKNTFGHPSQETLGRLADQHIPILRTDQGGDITIESDGNGFTTTRGIRLRIW